MSDKADFLAELGVSALGSRLRRLFETLNGPVTQVYRDELGFEQRWFALMRLLEHSGPISVQHAADRLGSSHVAVLQAAKAMESHGLLSRRSNDDDRRITELSLTQFGHETAGRVRKVSAEIDSAADALLAASAPHLLEELEALERALRNEPFERRISAARSNSIKE